MNRALIALLLLYAASLICGQSCSTGQPPSFTLEPQDAVLPLSRDGDPIGASIHCAHESPDTNLTWFRESVKIVSGATRTIHPNGTLEFTFLIDTFDLSATGIEYYCMLSNAFGSVISRTAILQSTSFDDDWEEATPGNTVVDVTLGSSILLRCDPPEANPPPEVVWLSNGAVLDTTANGNKYKILASGGGLIIGNVAASDIGPTYRCRVTNVNLYGSKDSPLTYTLNQIDRYTENLTIYDTLQDEYQLALGSTAEFTCLAIANDATSLEYFYRRTDGTPIGSNVVRPVHDGPTVDGRTTMHINGITAANDGEYECLVRDIVPGGDSIVLDRRIFTITVTFPPAITSIPDDDQVLYTGDTHTFTCGATGVPAPTISYYFNAALITTGVSDGVLTLTGVTNAANTGPYQCFADNVRADSSALWVVTVRDPSAPIKLDQSGASATVTINSNLTLTVDVSADPKPGAVWLLNGGDLADTSIASVNDIDKTACPRTYQVKLVVVDFNEVHSGRYTVTISNRAGMLTFNFDRSLEIPAAVSSLTGVGSDSTCIVNGEDSMLRCTFGGVPTPIPLWYKITGDAANRADIPVSDAKYVVTHTSDTETELTIRNVASEDDIIYGCEATNTVNGTAKVGKMELDIDICSMPSFTHPTSNDVQVLLMRDVRFVCVAEGLPAVTYQWFYANDTGIRVNPVDGEHILMGVEADTGFNYLEIIEVTDDDEGTYICVVTTKLGMTESTFALVVNQPETTAPPTTAEPKTTTEDFPLYVIIVIGAGGGLVIIVLIVLIFCVARYYVNSKTYSVTSVHHHGGRDEEDDDQPYNPQYESLPAARPMNPPEYKPTPEYPSSSVITSRTPVPYNGSSSMMEMQKVSNAELSKGQMYNYNSTSALTKQDMIDGMHQPRYEDFLSSDGQFV